MSLITATLVVYRHRTLLPLLMLGSGLAPVAITVIEPHPLLTGLDHETEKWICQTLQDLSDFSFAKSSHILRRSE